MVTSPIKLLAPATYNLEFMETSPLTNNLAFNDTSPVKIEGPKTNNLLLNETSLPTINLLFIETSPLANIRMRSFASPLAILPAGAV